MKKIKRFKILLFFLFVILLIAVLVYVLFYDNTNIGKIEKVLGINNINIKNARYQYYEIDPSFKYPNNTYISFNTSKTDFDYLVKNLNMIKYSDGSLIDSILCIKGQKKYFGKEFWSFKGINYDITSSIKDFEKTLKWWKPKADDKNELYAQYYNDTSVNKTVNCIS